MPVSKNKPTPKAAPKAASNTKQKQATKVKDLKQKEKEAIAKVKEKYAERIEKVKGE